MSWQAEALLEKALIAVRNRDYDRAAAILVAAIHVDQNFVEAWVLRGNIMLAEERWFDAALHFDRAIAVKSDAHDAWNNLGTALANMGQWTDAEQAFRRAGELMPLREPRMGLANMFCTLMRLEEAAEEYRAALAIDPFDYEAHFNLGVTLLGLRQWRDGFAAYAYRWANDPFLPAARRQFRTWQGEDLKGKTILLYPEQGYGDEIMAARFAPFLKERMPDTRVILEARAPFARLARTLPYDIPVVTRGEAYPASIDYSCALLDVPMMLGLEPGQVPRGGRYQGYLSAPPNFPISGGKRSLPPGLNVGLCWGSGKHLSTSLAARAMKSIPIAQLKGLAMPGVNLISLQKPAEPTPPEMNIHDWTDELHDLADTAALISGLDLVISVDTAVAHLAGALGKPVWNFVRFSGYWPWLANSDEFSLWYPTMRLLRQPVLADWSVPIAIAVNDLAAIAAQKQKEKAA